MVLFRRFGKDFFEGFSLVMNALDNVDARKHVNRLCVALKIPLVEAGTAGYRGQVQVILPGVTECYECQPKPAAKGYPTCTIRNTPSAPVHCVVWAKSLLFPALFGDEKSAADSSADGRTELLRYKENEKRSKRKKV